MVNMNFFVARVASEATSGPTGVGAGVAGMVASVVCAGSVTTSRGGR